MPTNHVTTVQTEGGEAVGPGEEGELPPGDRQAGQLHCGGAAPAPHPGLAQLTTLPTRLSSVH